MNPGSIARRYARALLSIGEDTGKLDQFAAELEALAGLFAHPALNEVLSNSAVPLSKRQAVLENILDRASPTLPVANCLRMLLERARIVLVPDLAREFRDMLDQKMGRIRAEVVGAEPPSADILQRIEQALTQRTGKRVLLTHSSDPELIAGMVTKVGSLVYDGSIRTRLAEMRQTLLTGR